MILINAIAPIFLIVLFGWCLGRAKLVSPSISAALMQYVFYAAAPAIVFYAVISNPIDKLLYWQFWLAYPLSLVTIILLTALFFKFILRKSGFVAMVAGFGAAMANTVIIGYPILSGFIGHFAAIPMAITVLVFAVIIIPAVIFVYELKLSSTQSKSNGLVNIIKSAIIGTVKNPMIIGVILGLIISLSHITLPKPLHSFAFIVGESIIPVALFAVGLDLSDFKLECNLADVSIITFINLVIAPLVTIAIALLLHLSPRFAVALVIFSTVPTAKTLYVIAGKYRIYNKQVAAIISLTTVFSIITIPLFVFITKLIWPSVFKG